MFKRQKKDTGRQSQAGEGRGMSTQQYYRSKPRPADAPAPKKRGWLIPLFLIVMTGLFIYSLIMPPNPQVASNSSIYRSTSEYSTKAQELINTPLNRNKLTINTSEIADQMKREFAEINRISFNIPLIGGKPQINIEVIEPAILMTTKSDRYLIDRQGRAVVKNPTTDTSKLTKLSDQTGFEIKLGEQVLTTEEVSFMRYISSEAQKKGLQIKELVLPANTPSELYMYQQDKGYFVKFFMGGAADTQLGSYIALEQELKSKGISPSQYVDVRVEERVFVK